MSNNDMESQTDPEEDEKHEEHPLYYRPASYRELREWVVAAFEQAKDPARYWAMVREVSEVFTSLHNDIAVSRNAHSYMQTVQASSKARAARRDAKIAKLRALLAGGQALNLVLREENDALRQKKEQARTEKPAKKEKRG
jgi:hypothetical protein